MKKLILSLLSIVLLLTTACSSQSTSQTTGRPEFQSPSPSTDTDIDQPTDQPLPSPEPVTLEGESEYMIVDAIDISGCTLENGYFSGMMTFTSHTTQKYIDEYGDYFYRQIYFGFYNENGELVGDEVAQDNCVYDREYVWESSTYVMFSTNSPISSVKVLKIVCEPLSEVSSSTSSAPEPAPTMASNAPSEFSPALEPSVDPEPSTAAEDGISPEFQEAMDSYEAFFDEYVAFMDRYVNSDGDLSLLTDYMRYMTQYAETMEQLEAIDENELSTAELLYYSEVMSRISQKLLTVSVAE